MSDTSQGPGWWQASDDKWYPPETHPDYQPPPVVMRPDPPSAPAPTGAPLNSDPPRAGEASSGRPKRRRRWLIIGGVVVAAAVVIGIVVSQQGDGPVDLRERADQLFVETDLEGASVLGDEDSVSITLDPPSTVSMAVLSVFLDDLGFNGSAVMQRMEHTRALDGTQNDSNDHYRISWTYHPDNGLSAVLERRD